MSITQSRGSVRAYKGTTRVKRGGVENLRNPKRKGANGVRETGLKESKRLSFPGTYLICLSRLSSKRF